VPLFAVALGAIAGTASAAGIEFRWHHDAAPGAFELGALIEPLARRIERASGHRIQIRIVAETPTAAADLVERLRRDAIDIAFVRTGRFPDTFPLLEGLELPLGAPSAEAMSRIAWDYARGHATDELAPFMLLHLSAADAYAMHARSGLIAGPDTLKGILLGVGTRPTERLAVALDALKVPISLDATVAGLMRGDHDAVVAAWTDVVPRRLLDGAFTHADLPAQHAVLTTLMNRDRFARLDPTLRAAIDRAAAAVTPAEHGRLWDEGAAYARAFAVARGDRIRPLVPADAGRWAAVAAAMRSAWVADIDRRGRDGPALLDALDDLVRGDAVRR